MWTMIDPILCEFQHRRWLSFVFSLLLLLASFYFSLCLLAFERIKVSNAQLTNWHANCQLAVFLDTMPLFSIFKKWWLSWSFYTQLPQSKFNHSMNRMNFNIFQTWIWNEMKVMNNNTEWSSFKTNFSLIIANINSFTLTLLFFSFFVEHLYCMCRFKSWIFFNNLFT